MTIPAAVIPIPCGTEYEGERVRDADLCYEADVVEWVTTAPLAGLEDGRITIDGKNIDNCESRVVHSLAFVISVAGRRMVPDYEPVIERRIHQLLSCGQGIMHTGRRDAASLRISREAVNRGLKLEHLGRILHVGLHDVFGPLVEKISIRISADTSEVTDMREQARAAYAVRDARAEGLTDEKTDTYYSCTICQSHAPGHVCIVTPEHGGACGAVNWIDCRAAFDINAHGPSRPIPKGKSLDSILNQWQGVNDFVSRESAGKISRCSLSSLIHDPVTTCECAEAISCVLPLCNGIMTVSREYGGITPAGLSFIRLMELVGGGAATPGFAGHSLAHITQRPFFAAEGGIRRLVWMPVIMKQAIREPFNQRAVEIGIPGLLDRVADETIGLTEEAILPFLREKKHPALNMPPLLEC